LFSRFRLLYWQEAHLVEEQDLEEMLVTVELAGSEALLYLDLRMAELQMAVMEATPTVDMDNVKLAAPTIAFPKPKENTLFMF
jgi:hypothetical protein